MEIINICFERIEITEISIRDSQVYLKIFFDDGKDKEITRKTMLEYVKEEVKKIFKEIVEMERAIYYQFDAEDHMDNVVNVVFEDEDKIKKEMSKFLTEIKKKMDEIRVLKDATGFVDKVSGLKRMKLYF